MQKMATCYVSWKRENPQLQQNFLSLLPIFHLLKLAADIGCWIIFPAFWFMYPSAELFKNITEAEWPRLHLAPSFQNHGNSTRRLRRIWDWECCIISMRIKLLNCWITFQKKKLCFSVISTPFRSIFKIGTAPTSLDSSILEKNFL